MRARVDGDRDSGFKRMRHAGFVIAQHTWNGYIGVFGEGGETQQQFHHGEGVDVVYQAADNVQLLDAVDAFNGGLAQELTDDLLEISAEERVAHAGRAADALARNTA